MLTIAIIAAVAILTGGRGGAASRVGDAVSNQAQQVTEWFTFPERGDQASVEEAPAPQPEPAGDQVWILTEEELNRRIAERGGAFGPVSDVRVELNQDHLNIRFSAYGLTGTYRGTVTAQEGAPVVSDSSVSGPLGWVVSSGEIDSALNAEIRHAVQEQNMSVESVHMRPGELIFGVSGA